MESLKVALERWNTVKTKQVFRQPYVALSNEAARHKLWML
jgi:hypothetical protein